MKLASTSRTLFKPASFFRHRASSSRDSGMAEVQLRGGNSQRSQSRQKCKTASRWMPLVMSIVVLMQSEHMAPALVVPSMGTPHSQQSTLRLVRTSLGPRKGSVDARCSRPGGATRKRCHAQRLVDVHGDDGSMKMCLCKSREVVRVFNVNRLFKDGKNKCHQTSPLTALAMSCRIVASA